MTLEGAIAVTRFGLGARPGDIAKAVSYTHLTLPTKA